MSNDNREEMLKKVLGRKRMTTLDAQSYLDRKNEYHNPDLEKIIEENEKNLKELKKGYLEEELDHLQKEIEKDFGITAESNVKDYDRLNELECDEAFLSPIISAFKRSQLNQSCVGVLICGPSGSYKHENVRLLLDFMQQEGMLDTRNIPMIRCENYKDGSNENLLIQDLYAASQKKSDILIIDHFDQLSLQLTDHIRQIIEKQKVNLTNRYVKKENTLQQISQHLAGNLVDHLDFSCSVILLISDLNFNSLYQRVGTPFFENIHDVIELKHKAKNEIMDDITKLMKKYESVFERAELQLSGDGLTEYLKENYQEALGSLSLEEQMKKVADALIECKLKEQIKGNLVMKYDNELMFENDGKTYHISDYIHEKNHDSQIEQELNELVGLSRVKEYMLSLKDYYAIQNERKKRGLKADELSKHMIFMGNPGTGKTTVARIFSRYMKSIGILKTGVLVEVSRKDLVGQYVGHTAPLTMKVIESALGGVLFIDEAYSLYRGSQDSFGLEAIDTLVKAMEDHRDELIVILAGYTKEMNDFLNANSGLKSRFNHILEFEDYTAEQLYDICVSVALKKQYKLDEACKSKLIAYFETKRQSDDGNGRLARNVIEKAILAQSKRLMNADDQNYDVLLPEDFDEMIKGGV